MLDPASLEALQLQIDEAIEADRGRFDELCAEVSPLGRSTRRIKPYRTTAISLVGTDGGNNQVSFDPFMVQLVRVVDSSNNEYCLEAVTPSTPFDVLHARHLSSEGKGLTALGRMMELLGVRTLHELSMISPPPEEPKPSWVQVYRELTEWAILLDLVRSRSFATDTLIIQDGLLRSKVFRGYLFRDYRRALEQAIEDQYKKDRRRVFVAGVSKHSKVLQTYNLAMHSKGVLRTEYPAFVEVPRAIELSVYKWEEYARGGDDEGAGGEGNKFVAGRMYFVKFGTSPIDPVWAVDLFEPQVTEADRIFGYMLEDAIEGFPVPFYPQCLQRAHDNAALAGFDMEILSDQIKTGVKASLGEAGSIVDELAVMVDDPAARRYGA